MVFARDIDGHTERVEWFRRGDAIRVVRGGQETVLGPDAWEPAIRDLEREGFVEVWPNDQRKLAAEKARVLELVRRAFHGVELGKGIGLREGDAIDDYADAKTRAAARTLDEKHDWSSIPIESSTGITAAWPTSTLTGCGSIYRHSSSPI